jgi:hypothetical protein
MQRLILLALLSLIGIGGLFAARTVMGLHAVAAVSPKAIAADTTTGSITPTPAKGDRLPTRVFDDAPPITSVETVKVAPVELPKPSAETVQRSATSADDDIVSWRWHEGSKIIRRRRAQ